MALSDPDLADALVQLIDRFRAQGVVIREQQRRIATLEAQVRTRDQNIRDKELALKQIAASSLSPEIQALQRREWQQETVQ